LTATGSGGTSIASLTITVASWVPPQIEYFRANPASILAGQCTTLEWGSVSNATEARVEPDVGGVATPGSTSVCPSATATYVLTATGAGGTITASLVITVGSAPPPVPENVWADRSVDFSQVVDIHWNPSPGATYYVVYADVCTEGEFRSQVHQEVSGVSFEVEDWYMEGCTAEDSHGWIQACNEAGCSSEVEIPWPGLSVSIEF
jgi:hypothetical protein